MLSRVGRRALAQVSQKHFLEALSASRGQIPHGLRRESASLSVLDAGDSVEVDGVVSSGSRSLGRWLFPLALLSVGGTLAVTHHSDERSIPPYNSSGILRLGPPHAPQWVQDLAASEGVTEVLTGNTLDVHAFIKHDHMFSALLRHDLVKDLVCYYDKGERQMKYVIQLGSDVCGYPRIVHGGLTAAIIDESFGFLFYSLREHKQLPFLGPAFTAHLEVNYKRKIQAGRLLLCTTEVESVEGRKLWMKATLRDGPHGKVFATARALFVVPKTTRLLSEGWRYVVSALFPKSNVSFE
eukprot:jgi/Botrbrau1/13071/Bobra.0187s0033.1